MSNKRTHWNRVAKAVEKKTGTIIHERCGGYGCDECFGMGAWPEKDDRLIKTMSAWLKKAVSDHWAREMEWDRIQRQLHARIDAMHKRLESACDYLNVPFADQKPDK